MPHTVHDINFGAAGENVHTAPRISVDSASPALVTIFRDPAFANCTDLSGPLRHFCPNPNPRQAKNFGKRHGHHHKGKFLAW